MLTTTEQTFVADVSKLHSTRSSVSSYTWPDPVRSKAVRQIIELPVDVTSERPFIDEIPMSSVAVSSPALDVSSRFGLRLRELRRERNLTQLRMAREFGIDRSFISDVERGRKSISLPMLEVIALGMKVSLSELLQNL